MIDLNTRAYLNMYKNNCTIIHIHIKPVGVSSSCCKSSNSTGCDIIHYLAHVSRGEPTIHCNLNDKLHVQDKLETPILFRNQSQQNLN